MNQLSKRLSPKAQPDFSDQIAAFFKKRRLAAGVSIVEIENKLGIPAELFTKYESGAAKFPLDEIFALTNLLNIPPEEVMALVYDMTAGVRK